MTLSFKIFGIEVAKLELELDLGEAEEPLPVFASRTVERGVKAISKAWVKRMVAG